VKMKRPELGQIIQILANVGVIGGILFLAVEIGQNNDELTSQARFNYYANRIAEYRMVVENPEMIDVMVRAGADETLTPEDTMLIRNRAMSLLTSWEYEFGEFQRGRLTADEFNAPAKQWVYHVLPVIPQFWTEYREFAPQPFREFMEREIVPE
jgi:hypothetical protein